jgi:hypothetical protein
MDTTLVVKVKSCSNVVLPRVGSFIIAKGHYRTGNIHYYLRQVAGVEHGSEVFIHFECANFARYRITLDELQNDYVELEFPILEEDLNQDWDYHVSSCD